MESLMQLASALSGQERLEDPAKLHAAVFLAQEKSGRKLYRFRAQSGRVVSDELEQDIAQLEAGGFVKFACSTASKQFELVPEHDRLAAAGRSATTGELREHLREYLTFSLAALQAAAAVRLMASRGFNPEERLHWFRSLTAEEQRLAAVLSAELRQP